MSQRDSQYSDRGLDSDNQVVPYTSQKQSEDLPQVVPQGELNSGSELPESSRGLMNRSPFVYDEATTDWTIRGDDNVAPFQPLIETDSGGQQQSHLTKSLQSRQPQPATSNSPPKDNSVKDLKEEDLEYQTSQHRRNYCRRCYRSRTSTILHPCHHACLCRRCAEYMKSTNVPCLLCKQSIRSISPVNLP